MPSQSRAAPPSSSSSSTPPRWFHLLAGPNGAGKSTLYRALVREGILGPRLEFVNADLHEQAHLQHIADPEARSEPARQRQADASYLYDAAEAAGAGPQLVAMCTHLQITPLAQPLPAWAHRLIGA